MLQLKSKLLFAPLLLCGCFCVAASTAPAQGTFVTANSLTTQRYQTDFVRLLDGRVFFAGGKYIDSGWVNPEGSANFQSNTFHALTSTEIFNPATGTISPGPTLAQARYTAAISVLNDGRVAIFGGQSNLGTEFYADQIELYNPATNTFSLAGYFNRPRVGSAAITLLDGRVLLVGGIDPDNFRPLSCVVFAFTLGGLTQKTVSLPVNAYGASGFGGKLIRANDGRVLVFGGRTYNDSPSHPTVFRFDPATDIVTSLGEMSTGRFQHTVTLMANGRIFICGGYAGASNSFATKSCDIYDPVAGQVVATHQMAMARAGHWAVLLNDGKILINGEEVFDPATSLFSPATTLPTTSRLDGAAVKLLDGRFFIAGGINNSWPQTQTELFVPTGWSINQAPVANAGPNQILYADTQTQMSVTLNGTGSTDPEGQPITYTWSGNFGTASGATPTVTLPIGIHTITLTTADPANLTASASTHVAVVQGTSAAGTAQLQAQIASLNTQLNTLLAELTAANNTVSTLIAEKQALQSQLDAANAQLAQLRTQLDAAVAANASLQNQLDARLADLNAANNTIATLTSEKQALLAQLATANAQVAQVTAQLDAAFAANVTLQSQIVGLQAQLSQSQALAAQLNVDLQTQLGVNQNLAAQNASLSAQLASCNAQTAALTAQLATANGQIATLTAANAQLTAVNQQLTQQNSALVAQMQSLTQQLASAFNDPNFQIPGATPQEQLQNLVAAIGALNHGQRKALYNNLGGQN